MANLPKANLSGQEARQVEDRHRLHAPVIYEGVRQEGDEESARPAFSIWWSGIAADVSISLSVLAGGILVRHLPDAGWSPLVSPNA